MTTGHITLIANTNHGVCSSLDEPIHITRGTVSSVVRTSLVTIAIPRRRFASLSRSVKTKIPVTQQGLSFLRLEGKRPEPEAAWQEPAVFFPKHSHTEGR